MDISNITIWLATASVITTIILITKVARGRNSYDPVCNKPLPTVVTSASMIGLTYTLITKGFQAMIHDQCTNLGSVFTVSFLGTKVTFLVGPEVSSHFFQGSESEISHGKILEFTVPMFGNHVGHAVGVAIRNEQHRIASDAFKPTKLRSLVFPMLQEVEEYFAKWGQEGMIDLKQELEQVLMLITGRCLLGKEVREMMFGEVLNLLHQLMDKGLHLTSVLFPYAPTPMNRQRDKAHAKLADIFAEIVRSRKMRFNSVQEEDVLQNLIDARYRDGRPTTEGEVTGIILSLIFAGKHTSSTASTWTGARLLSNPKWLAAAVEEQEEIIKKHGENIDYNVLREMDVLHRCIKETLRMHPPSPALLRKVHKNFTVTTKEGREYEIPRGHVVASPVLFNCSMPHIYKDPGAYDPDRFGPGREEDRVGGMFSYTSFSGGRHACVGENYAYKQIKVIWSHLLRNFELELVSSFPKPNWMKFILEPQGQVMVRYKRRTLPKSLIQ